MGIVLDYDKPAPRGISFLKSAPYLGALGYWGCVLGPLYVFFLPLAVLCTVFLAIRGRWLLALALLVVSPMGYSWARGTLEYVRGTARVEGGGLVRGPSSIDPVTRLQYQSHGCVMMGNEWLTEGVHNQSVRSMIHLFGPMRGTYDGPYPDLATAFAAISRAKVFDLKQLPTDSIVVDGRTVTLRTGLGNEILKGFSEGPATDITDPELLKRFGEAHATIHAGRCVILGIPVETPHPMVHGTQVLILIDARSGKIFTRYPEHYLRGYRPLSIWR